MWTPPAGDAIYFVMVDRFANGDARNDGTVDAKDPQAMIDGIKQRYEAPLRRVFP